MKKFNNIPNQSYKIDNKVFWDSRSVAVNCVIFLNMDNNIYVLIGQRGIGTPDNQGLYNIPSGYLDFSETGSEAVKREVWEETGFDLNSIDSPIMSFLDQPWHVNTDPSANRQNVSLRYGIYFDSESLPKLTNKYSEPNEVADLKWINIDNLNQYEWAYDHDQLILQFKNILDE